MSDTEILLKYVRDVAMHLVAGHDHSGGYKSKMINQKYDESMKELQKTQEITRMATYTIQIEGLPEGWEVVTIRPAIFGVDHILYKGEVELCPSFLRDFVHIIVQKTKPRRIVLEETDIDNELEEVCPREQWYQDDEICLSHQDKIWCEVKEE